MTQKFILLRNAFIHKLCQRTKENKLANWNFYINSTEDNMNQSIVAQQKLKELYQDEKTYKRLKKINIQDLPCVEQRQLKRLLKEFNKQNKYRTQLDEIDALEKEIGRKYNSYVPKIDGKPVSNAQINHILKTSDNVALREKAYQALLNGGNLIAEDLRQLVIKRNEYAKNFGYQNFFEYKLKEEFEVDIDDLDKLMLLVYSNLRRHAQIAHKKWTDELKRFFNVSVLQRYHYGLQLKENPDKRVDDCFKTPEQVVDIAKRTYQRMGFDIDRLIKEKHLTLDLFPREKKNTHAFSFDIEPGQDLRILANLSNDTYALHVLHHELGHCVYALSYRDNICFLDQQAYPAVTEAVAMMMESIQKRENVLNDIVPQNDLNEFKASWAEDELLYLAHALTLINFEREMYQNPQQDLQKLWRDMRVKFKGADKEEAPDNGWATVPHFLSFPVYYQNYFRAGIIKAQIYEHLVSELGPITENPNTADYLTQHLFQYGTSLTQEELIKNLTKKDLSPNAYIKSISKAYRIPDSFNFQKINEY